MYDHLIRKFERLDRDVSVLSNVLLFFIFLLWAWIVVLIYNHRFGELWSILAPMISLLAALLVARVATRLIIINKIIREEDRRGELVRVTHHLLAVTQDLLSRVVYVRNMLVNSNQSVFALGEIALTIERRYETLLEREPYQYLPGPSVDLIISMSGNIFGICTLSRGLLKATSDKPLASIDSILSSGRDQQVTSIDTLINELNRLIDQIYELRASVNPKTAHSEQSGTDHDLK